MNVVFGNVQGGSPAIVKRKTGTIILNKDVFPKLPEYEQKFIIEHESGHYYKNTSNELIADAFASSEILGTAPHSLKNSINTLYDLLDVKHNPEHRERFFAQLKRVAYFDFRVNKNKNALKILDMLENEVAHYTENEVLEDLLKDDEFPDEGFNSFWGSSWRARKQAREELKDRLRKKHGSKWWMPHKYIKYRHDYKLEKNKVVNDAVKEYKLEKWRLKEDHKDIKAEGELQRPGGVDTHTAQSPNQIGSAGAPPQYQAKEPDQKDNKMLLYGGLGLLALLIVGFGAYKLL